MLGHRIGAAALLLSLLPLILITTHCGPESGADSEYVPEGIYSSSSPAVSKECEAMIRTYYDAVQRDDINGQASLWAPLAQEEARRQAVAWSKRSKEGLKVGSFHVEDTDDSHLKVAHYYLWVKDRKTPEGKAALLDDTTGTWRIKELR